MGNGALGADDLRYFLEAARTGRLTEAARILDVDHTTVSRRITALERRLGRRLFDRSPGGWRLTDAGRLLVPRAEAVESAVVAAYDVQPSSSESLTGSARIVTTDGFGAFVIAPRLVDLRASHPHLDVELVTAIARNSVSERHFDVAVTLEKPTSTAVRAEPLAAYSLRLYASREYLKLHAPIKQVADLRGHTIIWYVDALLDVEPLRILGSLPHTQKVAAQISNITGHWFAARSGLGVAPLPTYIGAEDPDLVPVLADSIDIRRIYWLVIPRELEGLYRIQAVVDFLKQVVRSTRNLES